MSTVIPFSSLADRTARDHVERLTSEHARMADLLRHLHAAHYGSEVAAVCVAQEYGLEPTFRGDWRNTLRQLLAPEIDELLTEVHTPAPITATATSASRSTP